jgi:Flp pilus assembly protein TadG
MRSLLRCRRGSVALATVIALVPLIGVVALGAEAGSWYVTKQHAQNAADSAAMSGALTIALTNAADPAFPPDSQTYDYRAKQLAAQNAFCNAGDTSYPGSQCVTTLPTGISQTVQIDRGTYASPTWTTAAGGSSVRATVSQQQRAYLAAVLGLSTVNIPAQAIAQIQNPKDLCGLGLGPNNNALTIGGSSNITGNGCGLMSNNTVKYNSTGSFSGSGWAVDAVSGCVASLGHCNVSVPYNYNMLPATNPLHLLLDSASFNSTTGSANPCGAGSTSSSCVVQPNPTGPAYQAPPNVTNTKSLTFTTGGTFIFRDANINFNGGAVTGTNVNIVLLGNSSLTINGGAVNLSANKSNATYPNLNGVLIDDQAPTKNNAVSVSGNGTVTLDGVMYFPNVDVTWNGTTGIVNTTCTAVVANTLTIGGSSYLSAQNCAPGTIAKTQVVVLVQ